MSVHHGMNVSDALVAADSLGCTIRRGKGSHLLVFIPNRREALTVSTARRDAPRHLTQALKRLERTTLTVAR